MTHEIYASGFSLSGHHESTLREKIAKLKELCPNSVVKVSVEKKDDTFTIKISVDLDNSGTLSETCYGKDFEVLALTCFAKIQDAVKLWKQTNFSFKNFREGNTLYF